MMLIEMRNKCNSKKPVVKLNFVVRKDNRHEKQSFMTRWRQIVDSVSFDEEHNWSGQDSLIETKEIFHACLRIWNSFTILWDGRAALCCLDYDGREILGNLNSQTIFEIWHGSRIRDIRNLHIKRNFSRIPLCRSCTKIR